MNAYALITGGSGGIGLELARLFASDGYNLILVSRRRDALTQAKNKIETEHNVDVRIYDTDLSILDNVRNLHKWTVDESLRVDFLVNNAGFGKYGFFWEVDADIDTTMISLNIQSLTLLTHLFLPSMMERRAGRILNLASVAAFSPGPLMAVYFATKHYVLALSEALHHELRGSGVTVTALCPGPTSTGFAGVADTGSSLFFNKRNPIPAPVALLGYRAMMRGRRCAICGFKFKAMRFAIRFLPKRLLLDASIIGLRRR